MSAIKLTIDGRQVEVAPGATILEAARQLGVDIPTFCHDPELQRNGACRICVVEVENARALVASCCAPAGADMVVHTNSERVRNARISILKLILANHPLDCITCEKTGECKLQDYCYRYGVSESGYIGEIKELPLDDTNTYYIRDMNKCILCGKCVGKCQVINGAGAIDFVQRGFVTNVGPAFGDPIEESSCVFCGMCVDTCPVGALTAKAGVGKGRPWEVEKVRAVCPGCDTGCSLFLHARGGKVIGVSPDPESPVNRGHLCVKGRFEWQAVNSPQRISRPLIKRGGVFVEAGWDEALALAAAKLSEGKERYGSDAVAFLSSASASNEAHFLFHKLLHAFQGDGAGGAGGAAPPACSIEDITGAGAVLVVGTDLTEVHPVVGYRVREAVRNGAKLIVADSRESALLDLADYHPALQPGAETVFLEDLSGAVNGGNDAAAQAFFAAEKRVVICPAGADFAGAAAGLAGRHAAALYLLSTDGNFRGALDIGVTFQAINGKTKAAFVMGESPLPGGAADLEKLDFLVVLDSAMTETAACADVVLPAAAFTEQLATYTNSEGRVQLSLPAAVPPGEARAGWEAIAGLACYLGLDWKYGGPEEIFQEIAAEIPGYGRQAYEALAKQE